MQARLCPRLAPAARRVCDMLTHTRNTYDQYHSIESSPASSPSLITSMTAYSKTSVEVAACFPPSNQAVPEMAGYTNGCRVQYTERLSFTQFHAPWRRGEFLSMDCALTCLETSWDVLGSSSSRARAAARAASTFSRVRLLVPGVPSPRRPENTHSNTSQALQSAGKLAQGVVSPSAMVPGLSSRSMERLLPARGGGVAGQFESAPGSACTLLSASPSTGMDLLLRRGPGLVAQASRSLIFGDPGDAGAGPYPGGKRSVTAKKTQSMPGQREEQVQHATVTRAANRPARLCARAHHHERPRLMRPRVSPVQNVPWATPQGLESTLVPYF